MSENAKDKEENRKRNVFLDKRNVVVAAAAAFLVMAIVLVFSFLKIGGVLRARPEVKAQTNNGAVNTFIAVADSDYEPFSYLDQNKRYQGYSVELVYEAAGRAGLNASVQLGDLNTAEQMLEDGKADVILNWEIEPLSEESELLLTIPTAEINYVIYGRKKISSIGELYGEKIAALKSFKELGLQKEITILSSYEEVFNALKTGQYAYAICPIQVGNAFLNKLNIRGITPSYQIGHTYSCMALKKGNEDLRNRLNIAIGTLHREGRMKELDEKWVDHHYERMSLSGVLTNYPWIAVIIVFFVLFAVFLIYLIVDEYGDNALKDKIFNRVNENVRVIERENIVVEARFSDLEKRRAVAEAANDSKTLFLSNMSQEIRAPLSELLREAESARGNLTNSDALIAHIEKIRIFGKRLLATVNEILELARLERGSVVLKPAPNDLYSILDSIDSVVSFEAEQNNLKLLTRSSDVVDSMVLFDRLRLNQVMVNLLSNAIKFTPPGGEIRVTLTQKPYERKGYGLYEFRIQDTGIGIGPDFVERIYEPFSREHPDQASGAGLGLAIVKRILDMMDATIEVDTAPQRGTEFFVTLELRLQYEDVDEQAEKKRRKKPDVKTGLDLSEKRVLLVEDDEISKEIEKVQLESFGLTVDTASDGEEAVKSVTGPSGRPYDLIFMDIVMPGLDGYGATKKIRALSNPELSVIPIVALTASILEDDRKEAFRAGMSSHLSKPMDPELLRDILEKFLA